MDLGFFEAHFAVAPGPDFRGGLRAGLSTRALKLGACHRVLADLGAPKPTSAAPKIELAAATGNGFPGPAFFAFIRLSPPSKVGAVSKGEERKLNARVLVT